MMATTATTVTKATLGSSSVRQVAVLLPPRAPPRTAAVGGWRKGVSLRLAHAASELGLPHHRDGNDGDGKNNGDVVKCEN